MNRDRAKLQLMGIVCGNFKEFLHFGRETLIGSGKGFQRYGDRFLGDGKEYFFVSRREDLQGVNCEVFYFGTFRYRIDIREIQMEAEIARRKRAAKAYAKDREE